MESVRQVKAMNLGSAAGAEALRMRVRLSSFMRRDSTAGAAQELLRTANSGGAVHRKVNAGTPIGSLSEPRVFLRCRSKGSVTSQLRGLNHAQDDRIDRPCRRSSGAPLCHSLRADRHVLVMGLLWSGPTDSNAGAVPLRSRLEPQS